MEQDQPAGGLVADPGDILARLNAALDEAAELPLACLRSDQQRAWLVELQRIRARTDGLACFGLTEAHGLDADRASISSRSLADLLAARARVDPRAVARDQKLAVWLRSYPVIAHGFVQGWLTRAHVGVLRQLDNRRTRHHLAEAQGYLVEAARSCTWHQFVAACRYWALAFDPDGEEPREQLARRSLTYAKNTDGTVYGTFTLDPLAGEAFVRAVETQAQRLFREDGESGADRSASQRRADGLVSLVAAGATRPGLNPPGALIHVVLSEQVAEDLIARAAAPANTEPLPLDHQHPDGRCELVDGTPIHPHFALALLATATFRRMVLGPHSEIVDLGRSARGFPAQLRQALLVQARGRCRSPGCSAPLSWLQADHLVPWGRHGPTALSNGQILCDPHNKAKRDHLPAAQDEEGQAK